MQQLSNLYVIGVGTIGIIYKVPKMFICEIKRRKKTDNSIKIYNY